MSKVSSAVGRIAAVAGVTMVLSAAAVVGTASSAGADPGAGSHFCEFFVPDDDGALNDPIHHNIEPLVPGLHPTNCTLQLVLHDLGCRVPALAFLQGSMGGWPPCGFPS